MNVYKSIIRGLNEAVEFEKGNIKARTGLASAVPLSETDSGSAKEVRKTFDIEAKSDQSRTQRYQKDDR